MSVVLEFVSGRTTVCALQAGLDTAVKLVCCLYSSSLTFKPIRLVNGVAIGFQQALALADVQQGPSWLAKAILAAVFWYRTTFATSRRIITRRDVVPVFRAPSVVIVCLVFFCLFFERAAVCSPACVRGDCIAPGRCRCRIAPHTCQCTERFTFTTAFIVFRSEGPFCNGTCGRKVLRLISQSSFRPEPHAFTGY
jgi:hypothetical protein